MPEKDKEFDEKIKKQGIMRKPDKVSPTGRVKMPDTYLCDVGADSEIDVYFGNNHGIVVIASKRSKLSDNDLERIKTLINQL